MSRAILWATNVAMLLLWLIATFAMRYASDAGYVDNVLSAFYVICSGAVLGVIFASIKTGK